MRNNIEISCTPFDEKCVQVSSEKDYMFDMRKEAYKYKTMLEKKFANCNKIDFSIKTCQHDFGPYLEIHINFDDMDETSYGQAIFVENNLPATWADTQVLDYL